VNFNTKPRQHSGPFATIWQRHRCCLTRYAGLLGILCLLIVGGACQWNKSFFQDPDIPLLLVPSPLLSMSAIQDASPLPPPLLHRPLNCIPPIQAHPPSAPAPPPVSEPPRMIFTRQLWQRNMPEDSSEQGVSTRSYSHGSVAALHNNNAIIKNSRRTSSNVSTRSLRRASSPSGKSQTPLTPEESPPFRSTRKRDASIVEEEDKGLESNETSPVHTRASSGDSAAQVCICQPDPKIPRPRNGM